MSGTQMHKIWIEQHAAAQAIKLRHGLKAAFDYLIAEKLLNFASAAAEHPEFARELPRFVSQVRLMFTPNEIRINIKRVEDDLKVKCAGDVESEDLFKESPATLIKRAEQFTSLKEILTVAELGTS